MSATPGVPAPATPPPAGWYPQPDGSQRYWDGQAWTDHVAPGSAPVAPPARPRYEGIRWCGVTWGRSGRPTPPRIAGGIFAVVAAIHIFAATVTLWATTTSIISWMLAINAVVFTLGTLAWFIEAHFAARVAREQEPLNTR
ncbi:DUF2510 domain-containing protein [Demequina sp.]|uniref:DUF2510 domain-containing protein n=1 Tax=Demequina sp. TaxID=2050685 RepID=UPI003A8C16D7